MKEVWFFFSGCDQIARVEKSSRTISLHDGSLAGKAEEGSAIPLTGPTQRRHQTSAVHRSIPVMEPFKCLYVSYNHNHSGAAMIASAPIPRCRYVSSIVYRAVPF